jgi:hypothetical protein
MSKKIDIKRTLGNPTPPLSIEAVEEMTRLIHDKTPAPVVKTVDETPVPIPLPLAVEKTASPIIAEKGKRGRKPSLVVETERLIRVSVDLPESVFIDLKVFVIQQKTDMKSYIRQMVEREMSKKK